MFGGLLDLRDLVVSDVMIHRTEMITACADDPPEEVIRAVLAEPVTRIPLWSGTPENIVGILHAKDLLRAIQRGDGDWSKIDVKAIARPPWFVPDIRPLSEQLKAFRRRKTPFAHGGRRVRRGDGGGHARGHSGGDRRRHHRRARRRGAGRAAAARRLGQRRRRRADPRPQPRHGLDACPTTRPPPSPGWSSTRRARFRSRARASPSMASASACCAATATASPRCASCRCRASRWPSRHRSGEPLVLSFFDDRQRGHLQHRRHRLRE